MPTYTAPLEDMLSDANGNRRAKDFSRRQGSNSFPLFRKGKLRALDGHFGFSQGHINFP